MKGIVFVKFMEFVEETWDEIYLDKLITDADLPSQGIYTASALYDDEEMFTLVGLLCEHKSLSLPDALRAFGKWLFNELLAIAPPGAHEFNNTFDFMHAVQNIIHVEVQKLHPDAVLPEFKFISQTDTKMIFQYLSPRKLCFLCEGLISGLAEKTGERISISQETCEHEGDDACLFVLEKDVS